MFSQHLEHPDLGRPHIERRVRDGDGDTEQDLHLRVFGTQKFDRADRDEERPRHHHHFP